MKICFFINSLENGGTEIYLLRFLRYHLDTENDDITIFCKANKGGSLKNEYEKLGLDIIYSKVGYMSVNGLKAVFRIVRNQDVVCDLTGNFAGLPMLLSRIASVKKRVTFYRASSNHFKPSIYKNLYNYMMNRLVFYNSTNILSNSNAAFEYFFKQDVKLDKRFAVIPNGVKFTEEEHNKFISIDEDEIKKSYNVPLGKTIIGHVGRFNKAKNFPFIFDVIKLLIERGNIDFHFVFCGRGTDNEEFQYLLEEKRIDNVCTTLGSQSYMTEIYGLFDCFFFPSLTEGQPNALIEAMYLGIPFVASNIPPIAEAIPKEAFTQLVDIESVKCACELLERICLSAEIEKFKYQSWTSSYYDPSIRFKQFSDVLLTRES